MVDSSEFYRLTGLTPAEANKKPSPFRMQGPSGKISDCYLIHLRGLDASEILSMKKTRVYFSDIASYDRCYLDPREQVIADQGKFVFDFVYKLFHDDQLCSMVGGGGLHGVPESVQEIQEKHDTTKKLGQNFCHTDICNTYISYIHSYIHAYISR